MIFNINIPFNKKKRKIPTKLLNFVLLYVYRSKHEGNLTEKRKSKTNLLMLILILKQIKKKLFTFLVIRYLLIKNNLKSSLCKRMLIRIIFITNIFNICKN